MAEKENKELFADADVVMVPISKVEYISERFGVLLDESDYRELTESIKIHGVILPIIVKKKGEMYQVVAGERRWKAAKAAGFSEIPVIIKEDSD